MMPRHVLLGLAGGRSHAWSASMVGVGLAAVMLSACTGSSPDDGAGGASSAGVGGDVAPGAGGGGGKGGSGGIVAGTGGSSAGLGGSGTGRGGAGGTTLGALGGAGGHAQDHCTYGFAVDSRDAQITSSPDHWTSPLSGDVDLVVP